MYTNSQEYLDLLYKIQDENKPSLAVLAPGYEPFYEIDLNTRTISAPEVLGIKTDHKAETVFFKVARHYDGIDLSNLCCIIQYINAAGEGRVYAVPYYDLDTCSDEDMILFPWVIDGEVTKKAGEVQYSVRFYLLDNTGSIPVYNLNTLPTVGIVEEGIDIKIDDRFYVEVPNLTREEYDEGEYYTYNGNDHTYERSIDDYDRNVKYYKLVSFEDVEWASDFIQKIESYILEMSKKDLTWIVV